ncbi:MAG TPA: hypothetical protein DDY13_12260 [Cytophagales bacterium]|jgi:hypothetical protein|nr:hypothetical protein [Cytophagales bacterium]
MFITPPEPFQFNPLKHHLAFVKSFISHHREKNTAPEDLADRLAALGANYTDMYCGGLGVSQLCLEMKEELLKIGAYGHQKYRAWLFDDDSEYKELRLSDGSCWTLRWGQRAEIERWLMLDIAMGPYRPLHSFSSFQSIRFGEALKVQCHKGSYSLSGLFSPYEDRPETHKPYAGTIS